MARISKCKHGRYMAFCDECYPKGRLLQGWQEGYNKLNKQHKWYNEIVAWAGGAEIEVCKAGVWYQTDYPDFHHTGLEFRIKPQPTQTKDEVLRLCLKTFMELSERSSRHDDGLGYYDEECTAIREVLAIKEPKYLYAYIINNEVELDLMPNLNYKYIGKIEVHDD